MSTEALVQDKIKALFDEVWRDDKECDPPEITKDTVLLETGLDSMGFAVLVTRLDEDLGFDPFSEMEAASYPRTFGDFISAYTAIAAKQ